MTTFIPSCPTKARGPRPGVDRWSADVSVKRDVSEPWDFYSFALFDESDSRPRLYAASLNSDD